MTLYIIRHGETEQNKQGIVQGSGVNADLNETGRKQARLFYDYYQNINFHKVITSSLIRTHQTVEPFLLRGLPHVEMHELNEISWGIHEGKKADESMRVDFDILMKQWLSGDYSGRLKDGESAEELRHRVSRAIEYFKHEDHHGKNILVCTHGRTLLCMLTVLNNKPLKAMHEYKHHNTCLYKFNLVEGHFVPELENDISHLNDL